LSISRHNLPASAFASACPPPKKKGIHAPERYLFTFSLSSVAVLLAISAYLLFRHLQDRFQDVADFYYGFEHDGRISGATSSESSASSGFGAGDGVSSDGRYKRELIIVFGSERLMLSFLPKANYAVLAMSLLACACLLFLAVVDLGEARYYHGTASAMFFALSIIQSLFLTSLIYALRRVQTLHNRQSNLRFYWKVEASPLRVRAKHRLLVELCLFVRLT